MSIRKILIKDIKNKSIVKEQLNVVAPLEWENQTLSINQDNLEAWNSYGEKINTIQTDLGDLGNQVVDINNKFSDYYTKTEIDDIEMELDSRVSNLESQQVNTEQDINTINETITQMNSTLGTNSTNIVDLEMKHNQQQVEINELKNSSLTFEKAMPLFQLKRSGSDFVYDKTTMEASTDQLGQINITGYFQSPSYLYRYSDLPKGVASNGSGLLVHINFTNDRALQLWYARENSSNYYQRHKTGSNSWTNWTKFSGELES